MSHAREPVAAAAPQCNTCGSTRLNKLRAKLALHFNGLENIDKPVLWTFRDVVVCTDCGEADLHFPPHELQWWEQDAQRKHTRVIFLDPVIEGLGPAKPHENPSTSCKAEFITLTPLISACLDLRPRVFRASSNLSRLRLDRTPDVRQRTSSPCSG